MIELCRLERSVVFQIEWKNMYTGLYYSGYTSKIVGNKAKGWISKRVFQENKAR